MTRGRRRWLECVINVSEGRDTTAIRAISAAAGPHLLDVHADPDHHRSVLTLAGRAGPAGPASDLEGAVHAVARAAVETLDLRSHAGAHPRIGTLDVVPWVCLEGWPVGDGPIEIAVEARDRFALWASSVLDLPSFRYGPERSLADVRREAWTTLAPDAGPERPHPTAGAVAVGARPLLVAYNLWLATPDLDQARAVAKAIRRPGLRTLGLQVGQEVQVSCNLTDPWSVGPAAAFDAVASRADVARAELVGLIPETVLQHAPRHRWSELDLHPATTIEARLDGAGLDGGRFQI
jgi:glutamate formiminotransferase